MMNRWPSMHRRARFLDVQRGGEVAIVPAECLVLLMDTSTSMTFSLKRGMSRDARNQTRHQIAAGCQKN